MSGALGPIAPGHGRYFKLGVRDGWAHDWLANGTWRLAVTASHMCVSRVDDRNRSIAAINSC